MESSPNKVSRQGLPSQVAAFVRVEILRGNLKPGDRLPTEQEFAAMHGVSRAVIREAIAKLRHEGLVVSRQGIGAFVASPEAANSLTLEPNSLAVPEDYRHLYELRLMLETGAAELAAIQRTDEDLAEMARCIDNMAKVKDLHGAYVETDIAFHRAVAGATKNPFVSLFISFVDVKLQESILVALRSLDFATTSAISRGEHQLIYDAIAAGDPAAAAAAMRSHLTNSSRRLGL
ncbi:MULTISPECIES: FadR/GntR family transcriptional regulator [Kaistia]|uniref:FadR/GntR family transcriptional regulator n=1 Tax=Kaistia nematophila TaxID=2994654 RepID=A0A9X3E1X1_9HYPH|nr:FadR/GntR family transcriptional regulator [Kaistia nematophila]MBN9025908.1 FadR family transcriptional regulator [Hyphomicrobiales bacterium]MBN9060048.1 FadR family transcriptional regulator [Hyphomicrobiales bacterium]MCX5570159.1 FadR/GntR family transcriptional regulator [Kaistia nematophila]